MRTTLVFALLLVACDKGGSKTGETGSGSAAIAVAAPAPAGVAVFVDNAQVAVITPEQIAKWPRVDEIVPASAARLGTWQDVVLKGKSATPPTVHAPSSTYPDLVPALFPGDGGTAAFGMFDPVELAKHGKPALREDGLKEVRIALAQGGGRGQNESGTHTASDPTKLVIAIKTPAGTSTYTGDKLLALPREAVPGGTENKGWKLATILAAAGVKKFDKLVLTGGDTNLNVDKTAFDEKTSIPYVKLNRQGQLRLRIYQKQGNDWQPNGGDLRDFSAVTIVK